MKRQLESYFARYLSLLWAIVGSSPALLIIIKNAVIRRVIKLMPTRASFPVMAYKLHNIVNGIALLISYFKKEGCIMSEHSLSNRGSDEAGGRRRNVRLDSGTMKDLDAMLIKPLPALENKDLSDAGSAVKQAEPAVETPREIINREPAQECRQESSETALSGPLGIDIGTTHITVAQNNYKSIKTFRQLNAFFTLPATKIVRKALTKDGVSFFEKNNQLYICGSSAEEFATMHGAQIRKPIESGLLNPKEDDSIEVLKAIINYAIKKTHKSSATICFSVPGEPIDKPVSTMFHESVIKMHLQSLGYTPLAVNTALSVILSELPDTNYTGIGVSIGGGMCNVCFSYLSVPVITYSIQKGGDYIDAMVGNAVGEPATKIKAVKENGFDLAAEPGNKVETGLHIFYDDLFSTLTRSMEQVFGASDKIPRMSNGIFIVLGGGSVAPKGCRERFEKALKGISLPFKISGVRIAESPLYATARGSLKMAMEEGSA